MIPLRHCNTQELSEVEAEGAGAHLNHCNYWQNWITAQENSSCSIHMSAVKKENIPENLKIKMICIFIALVMGKRRT